MNEKEAYSEALRLNRIHANAFRRYTYALKKRPKVLAVGRVLQGEVNAKDRHNNTVDELYALANYMYVSEAGYETQIRKYNTGRAIKVALDEDTQTRRASQTTPKPMLTREMLTAHLYYDLLGGTFEWQTGTRAGTLAGSTSKIAENPPPKQRKLDKTKLPRKPVPPAGYVTVSKETYFNYTSGNSASDGEPVYERFYAVSVPSATTTADQLVRTPYYLRRLPPRTHITLLGKKYTVQQLAYLYMGAGGDWCYSDGLDKAHRIHTDVAPEGLRLYCHKTNKPKKMPCRDGDTLNYSWEKVGYDWVTHGLGATPFFGTEAQAMAEFSRQVSKMRGTKQRLRNGNIMVTREQVLAC